MDGKRQLRIPVRDLACGGVGAITFGRALPATGGVLRVYVNPATETAYIDDDPTEADDWLLVETIERAGYRTGHLVER